MSDDAVKIGSIWKENDPRMTRFVLIMAIIPGWIEIRSCNNEGIVWGRKGHARAERFNGKRGGYSFVKMLGSPR